MCVRDTSLTPRNARLVLLALLANFVLMPLRALGMAKVLWLDNSAFSKAAIATLIIRRIAL